MEKEMKQVDHFFHMEWGADSHARRHSEELDRILSKADDGHADAQALDEILSCGIVTGSKNSDWSETYGCNLYDWYLKEQETMPWLTGSAQWSFKDFATPLRTENPVPRVNQKGLVERDFTPKEGFYVFQSYWSEKPMIHIYGHSWPVRWGDVTEQKLVKVYSNCEKVELFLNDKSQGTRQRDSQNFPAAGLRWHLHFAEGENHIRVVGNRKGTTVTDEIRFRYETAKWEKPARLAFMEISRKDKVVKLEAILLDEKGVQCFDSRERVRFRVNGDGAMLDNLGTSTGSRALELYNGRAEISFNTKSGQSVVSVECSGVPTAFLKVE
jgi:beta-galactosidase